MGHFSCCCQPKKRPRSSTENQDKSLRCDNELREELVSGRPAVLHSAQKETGAEPPSFRFTHEVGRPGNTESQSEPREAMPSVPPDDSGEEEVTPPVVRRANIEPQNVSYTD
ncbi:Hypothetical predicted protein [Scomber scombrus]|uniref:Uncharacterized protein n=1 Tax=Scomber scombrus TaxID=13677 RepID=A0AAV1Q1Y1_SCOSC